MKSSLENILRTFRTSNNAEQNEKKNKEGNDMVIFEEMNDQPSKDITKDEIKETIFSLSPLKAT